MIREEKAGAWRCGHRHPALVSTSEAGRRARCLGCGATGPWRASLAEALGALKRRQETLESSLQAGRIDPAAAPETGAPTG